MDQVFLSFGSNLGLRDENINKAIGLLGSLHGNILKTSSLYETEPWGTIHETNFYNLVIEINTHLEPTFLLGIIHEIERLCGRMPASECYAPRTMDIDILLFQSRIISSGILTVPHPLIQARRFILIPLAEIAPYFIHPILHKTIVQLLEECTDNRKVIKIR